MVATEYEGLPIRKHSLAVRGASGDALSKSLRVKPHEFKPGVPAYVLLEVMPTGVRHDSMDDGEAWDLVNVTKVARGTIVTAKIARPILDEVSVALEDLRVKETGQERLAVETRMADDHRAGLHKRPRKQCELCQNRDPLGVGEPVAVGASAKKVLDDVKARAEASGEGHGDPEHPLPQKRVRRSRAKKQPKQTSTRA